MSGRGIGEALGGAAFGALFGVAGTIWASTAGYMNKDRELDLEMVRLSISILSAPASFSDNDQLQRRFAVHALRQFSGVDMSDDDIELWAQAKGALRRTTNVNEVCGDVASSYASASYFEEPADIADAARYMKTLTALGCVGSAP